MIQNTLNPKHISLIAAALNIAPRQAENTMKLLTEGATVPFISRYRKEATGNLDEVQIGKIEDLQKRYMEIDQRRAFIMQAISEQNKMTPELEKKLASSWTMAELEDIYLPYKPKRKTRAAIAIEKGLEPLAKCIFQQEVNIPLVELAASYQHGQVATAAEALKGARDIMAEWINEHSGVREQLRKLFSQSAVLKAHVIEGKEATAIKYKDYFSFEESLHTIPSHRILAIFRAETEGFLHATIAPAEEDALKVMKEQLPQAKKENEAGQQINLAITDAYKRLLRPSLENEFRSLTKEKADTAAIEVFAENLRQLLLAAPLGPKAVLAIDPGYRTGCKVVALDEQGSLLAHDVIYPLENNPQKANAIALLKDWVQRYQIAAIAIGNGTAGRETEAVVKQIDFGRKVPTILVNENGASVYSASEVAREEFPDQDVTIRGAVSIGRRLMDPLAELVKIEPKSIGVGQYQHDVNQLQLKQSLDRVVISCVNKVGVNLNTASKHLLTYVSGLGPALAENIVRYRQENGAFKNRQQLMQVPRLGEKAFEQCAGFLRIEQGDHPLDNSAVHPERYAIVEAMATRQQCSVQELMSREELRRKIVLQEYVSKEVGLPTLEDILKELAKPSRDPRNEISLFEYAAGIHSMEDLKPGMVLPGIVTNITAFGAFVDIGVKQDGLVHISHLSNRFVNNPNEVVKLNQQVQVTVLEVDLARKRISLSMKETASQSNRQKRKEREQEKQFSPSDFQSKLSELKKKFG